MIGSKFNESIEIQINQNDLTKYYELFVENKKLKFLINFETYNNLDNEIENIFDLLEKK